MTTRRSERTTKLAAGLLAALVVAAASGRARADDKKACAAAYEKAQEERRAGHLSAAREQLLVCAQDACSIVVRKDCAGWLTEVDQSLPTLVVDVRGPGGSDVAEVRLILDGRVIKERLDGKAFAVDPGEHTLRFELAGGLAKEERILAREGEKNRRVSIAFDAAAPSSPVVVAPASPADPTERRFVAPTIVAAVIGGLGVVGYATFGALALGQKSSLETSCAPRCSDAELSPVRTKIVLADVSIAVAGAGLGLATVLFFAGAPSKPAATARALRLDAAPLPGGAAATLRASF